MISYETSYRRKGYWSTLPCYISTAVTTHVNFVFGILSKVLIAGNNYNLVRYAIYKLICNASADMLRNNLRSAILRFKRWGRGIVGKKEKASDNEKCNAFSHMLSKFGEQTNEIIEANISRHDGSVEKNSFIYILLLTFSEE